MMQDYTFDLVPTFMDVRSGTGVLLEISYEFNLFAIYPQVGKNLSIDISSATVSTLGVTFATSNANPKDKQSYNVLDIHD